MINTTLATASVRSIAVLHIAGSLAGNPAFAQGPKVLLLGQTHAQIQALEALCRIGLIAYGPWGDERINKAIATLAWGDPAGWPDQPQATAYKTCRRYL